MMKNYLLKIYLLTVFSILVISCGSREDSPVIPTPPKVVTNEPPKYDFKGTKIIAHRTVWKDSPENSLSSFENIVRRNAHGIEFDIRMSADGVLFVYHDPTINGFQISKTDSSVLAKQKINDNEYLPTLEEFLVIYNQIENYNVKLYFDFKNTNDYAYNNIFVKKFVELLNKYNISEDNTICFYDFRILSFLRENNSNHQTAFVTDVPINIDKLISLKVTAYALYFDKCNFTDEEIQKIKNNKLKIVVWTVNDIDKIKNMSQLGYVDAIMTDIPDKVMEIYK